jgi:hypothetical protein
MAAFLVFVVATRRRLAALFAWVFIHRGCALAFFVIDHHQPLLPGLTTYTTGC